MHTSELNILHNTNLKKRKSTIQITRTFPGAECETESHELLM